MSAPAAGFARLPNIRSGWVFLAAAAGLVLVVYALADTAPWLDKYPRGAVVPLRFWISDFMKWLINDANFGLFTFKQLTRSISWLLERPLDAAEGLLASGFDLTNAAGDVVYHLPRLSWIAVIGAVMLLGLHIRDRKLAYLVGACFLYLAVFGQWDSAMVTLSSILIAVPFGVGGGLLSRMLGHRGPRLAAAVMPILELMQTVPVFADLGPVLFLFGFGAVAAMIATIIYAMPPMGR